MPKLVPFSRGRNISEDTSITPSEGDKARERDIVHSSETPSDTPEKLTIKSPEDKHIADEDAGVKFLREQYIVKGDDARKVLPSLDDITITGAGPEGNITTTFKPEETTTLQSVYETSEELKAILRDLNKYKKTSTTLSQEKQAELGIEKTEKQLGEIESVLREGNKNINKEILTEFFLRDKIILPRDSDFTLQAWIAMIEEYMKNPKKYENKYVINNEILKKLKEHSKIISEQKIEIDKKINSESYSLDKKIFSMEDFNRIKLIHTKDGNLDINAFWNNIKEISPETTIEIKVANLQAAPTDKSQTPDDVRIQAAQESKGLNTATNIAVVEDFFQQRQERYDREDKYGRLDKETHEMEATKRSARKQNLGISIYDGYIIGTQADRRTMGDIEKEIHRRGSLTQYLMFPKRQELYLTKTKKGDIIALTKTQLLRLERRDPSLVSSYMDFTKSEIKALGIIEPWQAIQNIPDKKIRKQAEKSAEKFGLDLSKPDDWTKEQIRAFAAELIDSSKFYAKVKSDKPLIDIIDVKLDEDYFKDYVPMHKIKDEIKVRFPGWEELIASGLDPTVMLGDYSYKESIDTQPDIAKSKIKYDALESVLFNLKLHGGDVGREAIDFIEGEGILDNILRTDRTDIIMDAMTPEEAGIGTPRDDWSSRGAGLKSKYWNRVRVLDLPMFTGYGALKNLEGTGITRKQFLELAIKDAEKFQWITDEVMGDYQKKPEYKTLPDAPDTKNYAAREVGLGFEKSVIGKDLESNKEKIESDEKSLSRIEVYKSIQEYKMGYKLWDSNLPTWFRMKWKSKETIHRRDIPEDDLERLEKLESEYRAELEDKGIDPDSPVTKAEIGQKDFNLFKMFAKEKDLERLFLSEKQRVQVDKKSKTPSGFIAQLRMSVGLSPYTAKETTERKITEIESVLGTEKTGTLFKQKEWTDIRTAREREIVIKIAEDIGKDYPYPHLLHKHTTDDIIKNIGLEQYKKYMISLSGSAGVKLKSPLTIINKQGIETANPAALTELAGADIAKHATESGRINIPSTKTKSSFWDEFLKALKNLK
jgi:hypothetical protein